MSFTILIVDDDPDILEFLYYNLKKEGYEVIKAKDGDEGLKKAIKHVPDLIILDVMMPGMDGIETCYKIREKDSLKETIITFLTARSEDYTLVAGLQAGADDFIVKPIKPRVLVNKVESLLRRKKTTELNSGIVYEGGLKIDKEKFLVFIGDEKFTLPKKEFELLSLLTSIPERVFTREEIYMKIWGSQLIVGDRTIDVHVRKLREKLGDDYFQTVKGVGYKFNPEQK